MFKHAFTRLRGFMQAELMAELSGLRLEAARHAELTAAGLSSLQALMVELRGLRLEAAHNAELTAAELARLRAEMARRDEMEPLVRQMQSALLTLALNRDEV